MKKYSMVLFAFVFAAVLVPAISHAAVLFYIDDNGNIGVGNTNPQTKFDVSGSLYSRLATSTASSSTAIDWNTANVQSVTLNNATSTFSFTNGHAGGLYSLILNQDATGNRKVSWPMDVAWPGGVAPTLSTSASSTDLVNFVYDGISYLGSYFLNYRSTGIAFDNYTESGTGGTNTLTFSHTINASSDGMLLVCAYVDGPRSISSVTYNGVAMNQIASSRPDSSHSVVEAYYLTNPPTGTHSVAITVSSTATIFGHAISLSGANQSSQPDAFSTIATTSTVSSISDALSVNTPGSWIFGCGGEDGNSTDPVSASSGPGLTLLSNPTSFRTTPVVTSNGPVTAGSHSVQINWSTATNYVEMVSFSIAPAS